jgi:hypothetical protein
MIRAPALLPLVLPLLLAACMAPAPEVQRRAVDLPGSAIYTPGPVQPLPASRSNSEIAADIMELGFQMESGRPIAQFSRFEGPVRVETRGPMPPQAAHDLDRLLLRLRTEAGIEIARGIPSRNLITVEFLPKRQMRAAVPQAACFVVPNVSGWDDFVARRRSMDVDWTHVVTRTRVSVFVPSDATAQEMRDCMHEEISQALGPLNDLYRLADSVWNDDNIQTTLTGFDMLVLRVWHAPDLRPGMSPGEVAVRLPTILNRLNPDGRRPPDAPLAGPTPRVWTQAIESALGSDNPNTRRAGALRALSIARSQGWNDTRLALSLMLSARLAERNRGEDALAALLIAADLYRRIPGGEVHAAHLDMQLAVQALASGQAGMVLDLTGRAMPIARRSENAALLASLGFLRAEALAMQGDPAGAQALRIDMMAPARYGFGSDATVQARMNEIATIAQAPRLAQRQDRP